jgi:hypothetical protein
VFEDGVAFNALKNGGGERQALGVSGDVDAGHREQIEIDVAVDHAAGTPDIKIPAAEGKTEGLGRVHHKGRWRLQRAAEAVAPACGCAPFVSVFERGGVDPHRDAIHHILCFWVPKQAGRLCYRVL